jgi:hypothetical protein
MLRRYEFKECECAIVDCKTIIKIPSGIWPVMEDTFSCEILINRRPYELHKRGFIDLVKQKKAIPVSH